MVWGCFSAYGTGKLHIIEERNVLNIQTFVVWSIKRCLITKVSHKKHLMMGKSKELAQDLRNLNVAKHTDCIGCRRISKLLNVPVSTVGAITRKISDRGVKRIIRVVQEPRTTCGELQKDLELAGTIV